MKAKADSIRGKRRADKANCIAIYRLLENMKMWYFSVQDETVLQII